MTKLTVTMIPRPLDEKPGDYRRYCNSRPHTKKFRDAFAADLRRWRKDNPAYARLVWLELRKAQRWADDFGRRVIEQPYVAVCLDV